MQKINEMTMWEKIGTIGIILFAIFMTYLFITGLK